MKVHRVDPLLVLARRVGQNGERTGDVYAYVKQLETRIDALQDRLQTVTDALRTQLQAFDDRDRADKITIAQRFQQILARLPAP